MNTKLYGSLCTYECELPAEWREDEPLVCATPTRGMEAFSSSGARLLMYFAIAFHRGTLWCGAKEDLTFYPTLAHARNANTKRAAMYDSLSTLSKMLLAKSRSAALQTPTAGLDGEEGQTIQRESLVIPTANEDDGRRRKGKV